MSFVAKQLGQTGQTIPLLLPGRQAAKSDKLTKSVWPNIKKDIESVWYLTVLPCCSVLTRASSVMYVVVG